MGVTGIRKFEGKLRQLEKSISARYTDDYIVVFLTTENNESIIITYTSKHQKGMDAEVKTKQEFIEFFQDRKVNILFIDNIDSDPIPGSLVDEVFNGELTNAIARNKEISYYWYEED
jgi:hypothetical protein